MVVDWTQLPLDLVETISRKISIYSDYLRFRAVCRKWQSVVPKIPKHLPPQLPWLMLPLSKTDQTSRAFFDLSTEKFYWFNLPEASGEKQIYGSSHGWLIIVETSLMVLLFNPLNHQKIYLPPLWSFPNITLDYSNNKRRYLIHRHNDSGGGHIFSSAMMRDLFVNKIVLSSSPSQESEFFAVANISLTQDLAYCRRGDSSWMVIENSRYFCADVICHNGLFYALNKDGRIGVFDATHDFPEFLFILETTTITGGIWNFMNFLVSSGNELLRVARISDDDAEEDPDIHTRYGRVRTFFEVYKLNYGEQKWEKITSLGDRVLFVGLISSMSLLASDFPGCIRNCIYHERTIYDEYHMGFFNLSNKTFKPFPYYPPVFRPKSDWPSLVLFSPNPC